MQLNSSFLWHCSAQDDTHNRSVTVLKSLSMAAITRSRCRLQREGGWVPLLLWIVLFERHGCRMIALEWDPDRYDYLSENRLFLISWSIWDYTEFAEVRVLSFLLVSDLQTFCSCCYAVHLDSEDIFSRIRQFRGIQ